MKYGNIFQLISDVFQKAEVSCVTIGGFAVNHYQFSRATADIDFMMVEEDFDKALPLLETAGCTLACRTSLFATLKAEVPPFIEVDILFIDRKTLDGISKEGHTGEITGVKFIFPSLEHLIASKLHAFKNNPVHREGRDLRDIIELIKQNKIDIRSESFHELCLKYGNEEIYQKIKNILPWKKS